MSIAHAQPANHADGDQMDCNAPAFWLWGALLVMFAAALFLTLRITPDRPARGSH